MEIWSCMDHTETQKTPLLHQKNQWGIELPRVILRISKQRQQKPAPGYIILNPKMSLGLLTVWKFLEYHISRNKLWLLKKKEKKLSMLQNPDLPLPPSCPEAASSESTRLEGSRDWVVLSESSVALVKWGKYPEVPVFSGCWPVSLTMRGLWWRAVAEALSADHLVQGWCGTHRLTLETMALDSTEVGSSHPGLVADGPQTLEERTRSRSCVPLPSTITSPCSTWPYPAPFPKPQAPSWRGLQGWKETWPWE